MEKEQSYEFVDLGLSVMWATCNIGANTPEDSGDYYAWGEISVYTPGTYKYFNGEHQITKYCTSPEDGIVDNKITLDKSDDVAYTTLGGKWRMPTDAEWMELIEKCTWSMEECNGINGCKVESKNGNSIFLPAVAVGDGDGNIYWYGGQYWSSSLWKERSRSALYMYFRGRENHNVYVSRDFNDRGGGRFVRAVLDSE